MRLGIGTDNICIKVYNPQNQKLIGVYDTYKKAAARLGIRSEKIADKTASKKRVFSPTLNMQVAIRLGPKTKEMDDLIEKTNKYKPL